MTTPATYRAIRHRDARGDWFDIEEIHADGTRCYIGSEYDRHEARDTLRRLRRRAAARQALDAARQAAGRVNDRRMSAGRIPPDAVARLRRLSPSLVADRAAIAAAIRHARAELVRNSA